MSLKDRKVAAQKAEETKHKIPDGKYQVRMKDWEFGKSQKGADKYQITWKILKPLSDDIDIEDVRGKERKTHYLVKENWSLIQLFDVLEQAGADLSQFEEVHEVDDIFTAIEDSKMPKAVMEIEAQENSKYSKITITEVEKVLTSGKKKLDTTEDEEETSEDADEEETSEDEAPAPKGKIKYKSTLDEEDDDAPVLPKSKGKGGKKA